MFDLALSELALIAVVALVVVGPKDLPRVMRTAGVWMRKARGVAHEFQGSLEQLAREAELDDVRKQVERATHFNVGGEIARHIDPGGQLHGALNDPVIRDPMAELAKPGAARELGAAPSAPSKNEAPHEGQS